MDPVGEDVGTPVMHIDGVAFFGPVISTDPARRGRRQGLRRRRPAGDLPDFWELKRTRAERPEFD